MESRRKQIVISIVLLGFSAFYLLSSLKLKLGTHKVMGPGFIPIVIGSLLFLCSAAYLVRILSRGPGSDADIPAAPKEKNYRAVAGVLACSIAYPLVLEHGKFIGSTFIVGYAMLLLLRPRSYVFSFLVSLGLAVGCFLVFARLLGVALPFGPIEELLFRIGR